MSTGAGRPTSARASSASLLMPIQTSSATASLLKSANISPHILRRTLYKMDKQKEQNRVGNRGGSGRNVFFNSSSTSSEDRTHSRGGSMPEWSTTASSSGLDSPVIGSSRLGFMEGRISRFQLKRLRTKQQSLLEQGVWKSVDNCMWRSTNGAELKLRGKRLEIFAAVEKQALQKIAFSRLQKVNLGCTVCRPKESLPLRQRRQKCNRRKQQTVNFVEKKKESDCKSPNFYGSSHQVFGVPLSQCIEYEQFLEDVERQNDCKNNFYSPQNTVTAAEGHRHHQDHQAQSPVLQQIIESQKQNRCQSLDLDPDSDLLNVARTSPLRLSGESSKSSLSDQTSIDSLPFYLKPTSSKNSVCTHTSGEDSQSSAERRYASSDSLLGGSPLCQSPRSSSSLSKQYSCEPHNRRVPKIVQSCTDYLKEHGLQTVGLFRVAGSAKRCRQLRLELDSGMEIILADDEAELYPHDVATLLKEYFRDLPDPLLTKELYQAFVNSAKFTNDQFTDVLRYLVCLLPLANSDTLLVLLQFLHQVAKHSHDTINDQGILISGNKMNAHNLATIFGPTILRPGSNRRLQHWSDNDAVIRVVESMINHCDEIFTIPSDLQDSVYKNLQETDPDALDTILTRMLIISQQPHAEEQEMHATVYLSSQEELDSPVVTTEADGTTVVKTRQQTTHRIVYTIHKPTGKILSSTRESSTGTMSKKYQEELNKIDSDFADFKFSPTASSTAAPNVVSPTSASSLNPNTTSAESEYRLQSGRTTATTAQQHPQAPQAAQSVARTPLRKISPLSRLTEAMRPNSPKK